MAGLKSSLQGRASLGALTALGATLNKGAGVFLPGSSLDLDLMNDRASTGGTAVQHLNVTRASPGYAEDTDGNWLAFTAGQARRSRKGVLIEGASTNKIRNNALVGGVVGVIGSGGALPTNWAQSAFPAGITISVVAIGTDKGLPCIDIRFSGTPTATATGVLRFDSIVQAVAANGETWNTSLFLALIAGAVPVAARTLQVVYRTSGGATLTSRSRGLITLPSSLMRVKLTFTATDATTGAVHSQLNLPFTNGVAADFTLRLAMPQLEKGADATSPILTSGADATRAADMLVLNASAQASAISAKSVFAQTTDVSGVSASPYVLEFNGSQRAYFGSRTSATIHNGTQSADARLGNVATVDERVRMSFGFDGAGMSAKGNGGIQAANANAIGALSGPVNVGNRAAGDRPLSGYLQRLAFGAEKGAFDSLTSTGTGFFTNFPEADGPPAAPWQRVPTSQGSQVVLATVSSNRLVASPSGQATTATYTGVQRPSNVRKVKVRFSLPADALAGVTTCLISQPNGLTKITDVTDKSDHMVFTDSQASVQLWLNGGSAITLETLTYLAALLKDGTQYVAAFEIVAADTVKITLPDGYTAFVQDARFSSYTGVYAMIEHFFTPTVGASLPIFHECYIEDELALAA